MDADTKARLRAAAEEFSKSVGLVYAMHQTADTLAMLDENEALSKERDELRAVVERVREVAKDWRGGSDGMRTTFTVCAEELEAVLPEEGT